MSAQNRRLPIPYWRKPLEAKIISSIRNALPQVDIYHDYALENSALPLVVIKRDGGSGNLYIDHETSGGYEVRFYISVWSYSRPEALAHSRVIEAALCRLPGVTALGAAKSLFETDPDVRGMGQDFMVVGD